MDNQAKNLLMHSIENFPHDHWLVMDECHALYIYGSILAYKPQEIIEVGTGTGILSHLVLAAIKANQRGSLRIVDNWQAFDGKQPPFIDDLVYLGASITVMDEAAFFSGSHDDICDILIVDANHDIEPHLIMEYRRLTRKGGLIFVHDANHETFVKNIARDLSDVHHLLLTAASLPNERTARGLLVIFN